MSRLQPFRGASLPRHTLSRLGIAVVLAMACACQWNERWGTSGRLVFSRDGMISGLENPGPDPTDTSGVSKDVPPLTEDNIVDVLRAGGRIQVRPAGERGLRTLEYFRPKVQTGPGGVIVCYPNSAAQILFSDDSRVSMFNSGVARFGDPAKGEPWMICERLSLLELTCSGDSRFGGIGLPGGTAIRVGSRGRLSISLERDRYFQLKNEGDVPIEVTNSGKSTWLRAADWMDVPVIRNAPAIANNIAGNASSRPSSTMIGEASFPSKNVVFDPIVPKETTKASKAKKGNL